MEHGPGIFTMDFQNDGEFVGGCMSGEKIIFILMQTETRNPVYLSIIPMEISEKIQFLRY